MRISINGGAGWALHQLFAFPARCRASAPQRFDWTLIIRAVSAASAAAIVCSPAIAAAPGSRALAGSAPRILTGSVSGPEVRPRSDRPAIRRTLPDGLTGPPKKGANGGSVRGRRYHRIVPLRTHVCRYGEYESSKISLRTCR
jgi:hypothetical protein